MTVVFSPRVKKRRIRRFFIPALVLLFLGGWWSYSALRELPGPSRITERSVIESTKIYDRTGLVLLYEIHGEERRTTIRFSEISPNIKWATLVAEDINFYRHGGIDFRGIGRALIKNIVRGDVTQGGSTITQQLVKNSILTGERTLARKFKEAILAVALETKYSKDEIFELYLNQIPYGSNAYGIAAAAQTFFSKKPEGLSLAESALLAALPKAPTYYSPYGSHKEELMARKDKNIERMREAGFVSQEEAARAKKEHLTFAPPHQSIRAPHFVMYVREHLNEKYGEDFVERGGLKVITSLDWKLQEEAEKIVKEEAEKNENLVKAANAALVALDPKSGDVLALVGSKDFLGKPYPDGCTPGLNCRFDPHVNVVIRPRQPGSAFKPFVYATAFKKGYTTETVLMDVPTEFNPLCGYDGVPGPTIKEEKECYHPQNYDETFRGPVSLRQALAQSLNVPSVKLLYLAGVEDSIKTAETLGITTLKDPNRYGLSLVLGGAEVTLLEMTSAFGVFSQDGILHPKNAILKIEDSRGAVLEEKKESSLAVLDTEVARTINDVLSDNEARVPTFNPRSSLYFPGRQVAAKTGTTQEFRDAWVIGYTPSLVVGVWAGNNDNASMQKGGLSIMVAGPLWHRLFEFFLAQKPPEEFTPPEKTNSTKAVLRGHYRSGSFIKIDKISRKLATVFTPAGLVEEISTGEIKSILSFIRREDPTGDPPSEPPNDPQFKNWEEAIKHWLSANKIAEPSIPKEPENLHDPDKKPQINFLGWRAGVPVKGPITSFLVKIRAVFPLQEVSLFINEGLMSSKTTPIVSETINFYLPSPLGAGSYRIKITAYDAVGNSESHEEELTVW
ncbi:MAG: transglycosylase domain-containing protein [Candidatus Sungiibacteriota bacterium]|uniref:Transglycosylase domain-containing protein n=1 Tax=Candidatus Sungiibacteriota bacterium TaxID=2750080 RepID=A0A7T5RIQ6_9BACT|nr:MAG: transglycosylase domain-containing protein [Candidatus Sungbacteria bacterium]